THHLRGGTRGGTIRTSPSPTASLTHAVKPNRRSAAFRSDTRITRLRGGGASAAPAKGSLVEEDPVLLVPDRCDHALRGAGRVGLEPARDLLRRPLNRDAA